VSTRAADEPVRFLKPSTCEMLQEAPSLCSPTCNIWGSSTEHMQLREASEQVYEHQPCKFKFGACADSPGRHQANITSKSIRG
jgi:hypothetical protein